MDLRTTPQITNPLRTPVPSLFVTDGDVSGEPGATVITDDPAATLTGQQRQALASLVGQPDLSATRFNDAILEMLSDHADPAGLTATAPLMPTRSGRLEIFMGGVLVKRLAFDIADSQYNGPVLARTTLDYKKIRAATVAGRYPALTHRKYLGALTKKYRTQNYRQFQNEEPDEEPILPSTTLSDGFTSIGNYDDLSGEGFWSIVSNQGSCDPATPTADSQGLRYNVGALSDDGHRCTVDYVSSGSGNDLAGGAARVHSSNHEYYVAGIYKTGFFRMYKVQTGNITNITPGGESFIGTPPQTAVGTDADGSTITEYADGSPDQSQTDTDITGNLYVGVGVECPDAGNVTVDNLSADDFASGGGANPLAAKLGSLGIGI